VGHTVAISAICGRIGAALVRAAPPASVPQTERRATCRCRLGAAFMLAALAPAVRLTVQRAARRGLRAVLVLAAFASPVLSAVLLTARGWLRAVLVLAPLASAVRDAARRAAGHGRLRAAFLLAASAAAVAYAIRKAARDGDLTASLKVAHADPYMGRAELCSNGSTVRTTVRASCG